VKHFSILFICLILALSAKISSGQAQSNPQSEQNQSEQTQRRNAQRPNRQGKHRGERMRQRLAKMDADKDQKISRDEWKRRPKGFDRLDTDHDGFITREEITTLREQRRKRNNPNATKPPVN
jgi:Ca2+-binding EF-hand superfamily protein